MGRTYQLKQRAENQEATRRRIVDATIALHQSRGDVGTTVSAIAERAGVGRTTVYRHFPDERALLTACTSHYFADNPPPDPSRWADIDDPDARLCTTLEELYAYYRQNETMLARAEEDAPTNPVLAELLAPFNAFQGQVRDLLMVGRDDTDALSRPVVAAAIGHALAFGTWRSLARDQGVDDAVVVALMTRLVDCAPEAAEAR